MGAVITKVDTRTNFNKDKRDSIKRDLGGNIPVFETYIPYRIEAQTSISDGESLEVNSFSGAVLKAYRNLAKEVLSK